MTDFESSSDEIRLLEWANVLLGHRWLIVVLALGAGLVAYGLCKMAQPLYTAETTLIANREAEALSLDRIFGSGLARARSEMLDRFSATLVSSYYVELLRSDPLLQPLSDRKWSNGQTLAAMYELQAQPGVSVQRQALDILRQQVVEIRQDKVTGMLAIQCKTPEPRLSAEIANALVEELTTFLRENRSSGTMALIQTAEARTSGTALALQRAEGALRDFRTRNKTIVSPDLKLQEGQLEREIRLQEELFIKLKTQVELLRIGHQNDTEPIIIIQPAEVPVWKSWPPTRAAAFGATVFGMLLGVAIAFVRHGIQRLAAHDAPGFAEFERHVRSLNWLLPGLVFLLPAGARRRGRLSTGPAPEA